MKDLWIKAAAGLAVAAASAGATAWATTQSNEQRIVTIESELSYIRGRVDAIYDRLPARTK